METKPTRRDPAAIATIVLGFRCPSAVSATAPTMPVTNTTSNVVHGADIGTQGIVGTIRVATIAAGQAPEGLICQ
ncbi:MAG TPA: hypothetical protein VLZ30_04495 [Verrucomicrobiae bacterium]|nr:hypothetical protein [Verrucomicrobiae bacterium]